MRIFLKRVISATLIIANLFTGMPIANSNPTSLNQAFPFATQPAANPWHQVEPTTTIEKTPISLTSEQIGMQGPLSFGINYHNLLNYYLNALYVKKLSEKYAVAGLAEYGPNTYRIGATMSMRAESLGLFKVSAEYLTQVLPFSFISGNVNQRMGQKSYGARYQRNFEERFHIFDNISIGGYYSTVPNHSLNSVIYLSNGSNCNGTAAGFYCLNYRNIAGGTADGIDVGTDMTLSRSTQINARLHLDKITYDTNFIPQSTYNNAGLGGTLSATQLISDHIKTSAELSLRKIYDTYNLTLAWLPPSFNKYGMEVALTGQHLTSHNSTPDNNQFGLNINFNLMSDSSQPAHYELITNRLNNDIATWVSTPAVHMDRVLATADEKVKFLGVLITSITPSSGYVTGGEIVTIHGLNFYAPPGHALAYSLSPTNAASGELSSLAAPPSNIIVTFAGIPATDLTVINTTTMTCVVPANPEGPVTVAVITPEGTFTFPEKFTYINASAPSISNVSPTSGPAAGGSNITITGSHFTGATSVTFGGLNATSFTVTSDTEIRVVTPAHTAGAINITVTTPSGTTTLNSGFTYNSAPSISSLTPTSGTSGGGTNVIITGSNFTGATSVTFGGTAVTSYTVDSTTQITATTAVHSAGTVDVVVTTSGGTATSSGGYTYVAAPSISSLTPTSGTSGGGTNVIITGSNFTGATSVTFGGTAVTSYTVDSATQITATTAAHAAGTVDVVVTTSGGTATSSGGYTYVAAPNISGISPTSGSAAGGTSVVITGTNFTGATSVTFGGTAVTSYTVDSATQITVVTPAHAIGAVDVRVTTSSGSATSAGGYTYYTVPVTSQCYRSNNAGHRLGHCNGLSMNGFGTNGAAIYMNYSNCSFAGIVLLQSSGAKSLSNTVTITSTSIDGTGTSWSNNAVGCNVQFCDNSTCTGKVSNIVTVTQQA